MLNKSGPSIELCGTLAMIFSQELKLLWTWRLIQFSKLHSSRIIIVNLFQFGFEIVHDVQAVQPPFDMIGSIKPSSLVNQTWLHFLFLFQCSWLGKQEILRNTFKYLFISYAPYRVRQSRITNNKRRFWGTKYCFFCKILYLSFSSEN